MSVASKAERNPKEIVPFLHVSSMELSVRFYLDGIGFTMKHNWVAAGKLRWCWLSLGGASLMLQEFPKERHGSWVPAGKVGEGVSLISFAKTPLRSTRSSSLVVSRHRNRKSAEETNFSQTEALKRTGPSRLFRAGAHPLLTGSLRKNHIDRDTRDATRVAQFWSGPSDRVAAPVLEIPRLCRF